MAWEENPRICLHMQLIAILSRTEVSIDHPDAYFKVYEVVDDCYRVEMKVKCNRDGNFMHILRVYKKQKQ